MILFYETFTWGKTDTELCNSCFLFQIPLPFFPHKNVIQKTIYQQAQLPRESQPLPQFVPKTDPNFIRPNEEPNINYRIQYNMDLQPHLPPIQGEMNWIPQQTNQIVPQMNPQNVGE